MTNTQNLKGVQRSKKACFDQHLCNILSFSTEIEKTHKHHSVHLKGNNLCIYIQAKIISPSVQVILKLPYTPIIQKYALIKIWHL